MENQFTKHLKENGWCKINYMTYQFHKDNSIEIFFDNSNQIELYIDSKIISLTYLKNIEDLISFLIENKLNN